MANYFAHYGEFYSNIGDGSDPEKVDFAIIAIDTYELNRTSVVVLKKGSEVAVFNRENLLDYVIHGYMPTCLLSKKCETNDEAYLKFLKVIGKMIKKGEAIDEYGNLRVSRYFAAKTHKNYETFPWVLEWAKMIEENEYHLSNIMGDYSD